jgi:hypothetical protein
MRRGAAIDRGLAMVREQYKDALFYGQEKCDRHSSQEASN